MVNALNRIRWQCRRGMLELDLYLLPFFDEKYQQLSVKQQQIFESLLNTQDPVLYQWFLDIDQVSDPEFKELIQLIVSHAKHRH